MAREEDDDDSLPPIGEDTEKFLEDAKKGKPRSFLLICKGNKVKYLKVKKKAVKKNEINEAKKLGYKGDSYIGVITGKGMDLVFNLAIADGYESEPCKDKILKDFLEEHAEFKCKPSFAIVQTAPDIPFDDEDLSHPLVARFLALGEKISKVLDAKPDAESEIKQEVSSIRELLQDEEFNQAEPRINQLETRLNALLSGGETPATTQQGNQQLDNDALKAKLQDALNKLVPQLKQAVTTYPEKKVELLTPVAAIKQQLEAGQLQEARQGILNVGQLLKSVLSGGGNNVQQQETPQQKYEKLLAKVEPRYNQALSELIGDPNKFRMVMDVAKGSAGTGDYDKACVVLQRLSDALERDFALGVKETDVIRKGIVAEQVAKLEEYFRRRVNVAQTDTTNEVAKIEQGLQQVPEEEPAELAKEILSALNETYAQATDELVALARAGDKNAILEGVRNWRTNISKDPLILHLETCGSEVGVAAQVLGNFESLFNDFEAEVQKSNVVTA